MCACNCVDETNRELALEIQDNLSQMPQDGNQSIKYMPKIRKNGGKLQMNNTAIYRMQ